MMKLSLIAMTAVALTTTPVFSQDSAPQPQTENEDFEILMESDQPEGWPEPGPAFELALKHYPAYRAAVVEGSNGFWPLFRHISGRGIPMTAPVEMDMAHDDGRYRMTNMAFLYQSIEVGGKGESGDGVVVIDYPAISALSFGSNGSYDQDRIDEILAMIDAYMETLAGEWRATGEIRIMGYNSPMIPSAKRYYEVQVIVEPVPEEEMRTEGAASDESTPE